MYREHTHIILGVDDKMAEYFIPLIKVVQYQSMAVPHMIKADNFFLFDGGETMDIKQIIQNIIDTYEVAKPLYENETEIFESNLPLYPNYEILYKIFVNFQDIKPDILTLFENINDLVSISDLIDELEPIKESLPEEYKESCEGLIKMLQVISFYRRL